MPRRKPRGQVDLGAGVRTLALQDELRAAWRRRQERAWPRREGQDGHDDQDREAGRDGYQDGDHVR